MRYRAIEVALALAMMMATGAAAQTPQSTPIELRDGRDFRHDHTRMGVPAALVGLPRRSGAQLVADQLDISFQYESDDRSEMATVYLYRVAIGDLPLWFDRAIGVVTLNPTLGKATAIGSPASFALPGQSMASALAQGFDVDGSKEYRGSALAMAAHGEWLVKLRYSSKRHDAATAVERAEAMIGALKWPRKIDGIAAVAPIAPCATRLAFEPDAKPVVESEEARMQRAILGGVLGSLVANKKLRAKAKRLDWCRHGTDNPMIALYSTEGAADSYLIALSDSGIGLRIDGGADGLRALIDKERKVQPNWQASLWLADRVINFQSFDGLPPVDTALATLKTKPVGTASTWGDKPSISIAPSE